MAEAFFIPPPPCALLLTTNLTMAEQAEKSGISRRHLYRLVQMDSWNQWKIGDADNWCRVVGHNLWKLNGTSLARVDWDLDNLRHRRALRAIITSAHRKPTEAGLASLARSLKAVRSGVSP